MIVFISLEFFSLFLHMFNCLYSQILLVFVLPILSTILMEGRVSEQLWGCLVADCSQLPTNCYLNTCAPGLSQT